jgi:hypothetical protein
MGNAVCPMVASALSVSQSCSICSLVYIYDWWCRYQQMGNAVCPMVASALGPCLSVVAHSHSKL